MMRDRLSDPDREKTPDSGENHIATSISVAIVSYNSRDLLRDCLASIEAEPWEQVIVVDNLSSDGSIEMVRQEFAWVNLIVSKSNDGYGAAANLAVGLCPSEYVLLLNCDTVLQPGALMVLGKYLEMYPQVAIVGPQLMNVDGTRQVSCFDFPTPLHILQRETNLSRYIGRFSKNFSSDLSYESPQNEQTVPWVLGAALAIRRDAFTDVGGFDETYFMYYEEVDLCYRLSRTGWQIHFVTDALVMHVGGSSTKHHRASMLKQHYKSLCHFYQQHYSNVRRVQLRFILSYLMLRNIVRDSIRAERTTERQETADNLVVWKAILGEVWSAHGWLNN
jgi:N-acetylglucosaminyl-diphospho-decaprenol L-rhamnosyltransferase